MKNFLFTLLIAILFLAACGDGSSPREGMQAQKNIDEITSYMIEKGLDPADLEILDFDGMANPEVMVELKKHIDSYAEQKKRMDERMKRMAALREQIKKANSEEEINQLIN
ncbi:MAG TPA: hypothetical protein PKC76_12805 [Saprospiraceae bacterium]|nr:hypothetical protein [Saprospiraceae bacterium]HMP25010.1 hypothetical protein [Saprospiraceae bacterium]